MRTTPNFTNHPVLQALLDVIEQSTSNHGTYATFSQRVNNCRDIDSRAWVSRIEAALSDQEKLGQLRIARREALLPFIANRAEAHKAFRDLVGHRSAICDAIRQGYELLDSKDGSLSEELKAAVANNILMAIKEHHRDDASHSFNWSDYGRTLEDECDQALRDAFKALIDDAQPNPRNTYAERAMTFNVTNHQYVTHVYPVEPVVTPEDVNENFRRDEMRYVPSVAFEDCVNSKHPALVALVALGAALETAVSELRKAEEYLSRNEKGRVNEKVYADRLMAVVNGRPDCGYGHGKPLPEQQDDLRRDYESARVAVALAMQNAINARKALAEGMVAAIEEAKELSGLDGKPVQYTMSIKPETIDRKEAATAAMLNCLAMDCLLRRSGRTLIASLKERGEDMTQGRGKKALFEAVEAARAGYKRISI